LEAGSTWDVWDVHGSGVVGDEGLLRRVLELYPHLVDEALIGLIHAGHDKLFSQVWEWEAAQAAREQGGVNEQVMTAIAFAGRFGLAQLVEPSVAVWRDDWAPHVAGSGSVDFVAWVFSGGGDAQLDSTLCEDAAQSGSLPVLQWLVAHGAPLTDAVAYEAAMAGHLAVIQWLVDRRCPMDPLRVATSAAVARDSTVLGWWVSSGHEWDSDACARAASTARRWDTVHLILRLANGTISPSICSDAALDDNVDMIRVGLSHDQLLTVEALWGAVRAHAVRATEFIVRNNLVDMNDDLVQKLRTDGGGEWLHAILYRRRSGSGGTQEGRNENSL
jgi:hypothetical protein